MFYKLLVLLLLFSLSATAVFSKPNIAVQPVHSASINEAATPSIADAVLPLYVAQIGPDAIINDSPSLALISNSNATEGLQTLTETSTDADDSELNSIFAATGKIYNDWKILGWASGMVAAIGLLISLLRFSPINAWLEKKGWKKYKVYFSAGLGSLSGFFSALAESGKLWPNAVIGLIGGVAAGFAATGAHQAATGGNTR